MKRFVILGGIGVLAILLAAGLDLFINRDLSEEPTVVGSTPALPAATSPDTSAPRQPAPSPADTPASKSATADASTSADASAPAMTAPRAPAAAVSAPGASSSDPARADGSASNASDPRSIQPRSPVSPANGVASTAVPATPAASGPAIAPAAGTEAGPAAENRPSPAPSFDIVRVNREGAAVIAGRAAPDATVTVRDRDGILGTVQADRRGDWVLLPDKPLEPGARELSVEAADKAGRTAMSEQVVVLAIPERDAPGSGALAVAVPRDEVAPSRLLQRPAAQPALPPSAAAGETPSPSVPGVSANADAPPAAERQPGSTTGPDAAPALGAAPSQFAAVVASGEGAKGEVSRDGGAKDESAKDPGLQAGAASAPGVTSGNADAAKSSTEVASAIGTGLRDPVPAAAEPMPAQERPRIDTIDYDEKGRMALSGAAGPGSNVGVFLDGASIGTASTDASGRWQLSPQADVAPGRYTLKAEERDPSGRLSGRVEMPFERAGAIADLPPGEVVVVQPGNSLWRIARRTYGEGVRYTVIFAANRQQIRNPDMIYPGQIFTLPKSEAPASGAR